MLENQFYAPHLNKSAPKAELSDEDRVYVNLGGVLTALCAKFIGAVAPVFRWFSQDSDSDVCTLLDCF